MNKLSILGIFVADLAFFGKIPKVGETILGKEFVVGPGGKGSNQSVAAGKAGASVEFITKSAKTAMLFSRTNTLLSLPMLLTMVAAQNLY